MSQFEKELRWDVAQESHDQRAPTIYSSSSSSCTSSRPQSAIVPQVFLKALGETCVHMVGEKQFILETLVCCREKKIYPKILVDTGAQPNLVKKGLFPPHLFKRAQIPLTLSAANSGRVDGGQLVILLTTVFKNTHTSEIKSFRGFFYEAEIPIDMILSNGWLANNKIIPLPETTQLGLRIGREIHTLSSYSTQATQLTGDTLEILGDVPNNCFDENIPDETFCGYISSQVSNCQFLVPGDVGEEDRPMGNQEKVFCLKCFPTN